MARAVVVNQDVMQAELHADSLRAAGYEVELCGGPGHEACPVLLGLPCPLADRADVLVYDAAVVDDPRAASQLIADVRETYPDLPVVLTSADASVDWIETEGPHRVTPVTDPARLVAAVDAALDEQGMGV
jgi:hypothetical protein